MEPWQIKQIESLKKILNKSMVYVDIGACRGELLEFLRLQCNRGYAFEPDLSNFTYLQQKFNYSSIELINKVVSDINGPIKFYSHNTHMGNILGHNMDYQPFNDYTEIESVTLDNFFINKTIDFIKLDVEGAEWRVFEGANLTLDNHNIIWQVEFHLDEHWHKRQFLYDKGYEIYNLEFTKLHHNDSRPYQAFLINKKNDRLKYILER